MMCYLIADEGSACPSFSSENEPDRTGLLFLYLNFERTKDNGNCYVEKQLETPQNVQSQNVRIRMRFWPKLSLEQRNKL